MMIQKSAEHLSEDVVELHLLDLSVSGFVDSLDEGVNLLSAGSLSSGFHLAQGSADEVVDFSCVQAVAVVLVELSEDGIDGISELLISISHVAI